MGASDVTVINDERGADFNDSAEGGSRSAPATPSSLALMSVVALDMSDSIAGDAERRAEVIAGAKAFVDAVVRDAPSTLRHKVALVAFGRPDALETLHGFSDDATSLDAALDDLATSESRGTTDLYGAYVAAFDLATGAEASTAAAGAELIERHVVVLTDGNHEAGAAEAGRAAALAAKDDNPEVLAFSLSIGSGFDEEKLEELASSTFEYFNATDIDAVTEQFGDIAAGMRAIAESNYAIGVCTPVALGSPSLTVEVEAEGQTGAFQVSYSTEQLTGELVACDPVTIAGSAP